MCGKWWLCVIVCYGRGERGVGGSIFFQKLFLYLYGNENNCFNYNINSTNTNFTAS